MKEALLFFLLFLFSAASCEVLACSTSANTSARFHKLLVGGGKRVPGPPSVEVAKVVRAGDVANSCRDVGILVLTIPADTENPAFAYRFEHLSSDKPGPSFLERPVVAEMYKGKPGFVFGWIEGEARPLDFLVKVTAYSRSGRKGGSTIVRITDPGR